MSIKKSKGIVRVSDKDSKGKKKVEYFCFQEQEYKGQKMFSIWPCDKEGSVEKDYPLLSMGAKKAQVLLQFIDELTEYVEG